MLMTYGNEDEISDVLNKIERPVHEAICLGKILCLIDECIAQRAYFHESAVVHHFRVKHKKEFNEFRCLIETNRFVYPDKSTREKHVHASKRYLNLLLF